MQAISQAAAAVRTKLAAAVGMNQASLTTTASLESCQMMEREGLVELADAAMQQDQHRHQAARKAAKAKYLDAR
jgi:hypothetical protein